MAVVHIGVHDTARRGVTAEVIVRRTALTGQGRVPMWALDASTKLERARFFRNSTGALTDDWNMV